MAPKKKPKASYNAAGRAKYKARKYGRASLPTNNSSTRTSSPGSKRGLA